MPKDGLDGMGWDGWTDGCSEQKVETTGFEVLRR
jgi:hypothetical protein